MNSAVNKALARSNAVLVPAVSANSLPSQPQDLQIWQGIVLMAIVPQSTALVKNGVRYKVLNVGDTQFELVSINDDDEHTSASFIVDKKEIGSNFRLTHAVT